MYQEVLKQQQSYLPINLNNDIQFWLNDQSIKLEPDLVMLQQHPQQLLLAESYYPHQEQEQDIFNINDFDYLYNTAESSYATSTVVSGYSSPSSPLSTSSIIVNDLPFLHQGPEIKQAYFMVESLNFLEQKPGKKVNNSNCRHSSASSPPPTSNRNKRRGSDCHQSLVISPASQVNKPYTCHLCPRQFARKHDLQRHIRVHTGAKPYSCLSCTKSFARTDALKRHLRMEEHCRQSPIIQAMKEKGNRRYRNL